MNATQLKPTKKSLEQVFAIASESLDASAITERALPNF